MVVRAAVHHTARQVAIGYVQFLEEGGYAKVQGCRLYKGLTPLEVSELSCLALPLLSSQRGDIIACRADAALLASSVSRGRLPPCRALAGRRPHRGLLSISRGRKRRQQHGDQSVNQLEVALHGDRCQFLNTEEGATQTI